MKIWIKYIIGIILGIAFAVFLPPQSAQGEDMLAFVVELVTRFGRYILPSMLFFSIATACFKLRDEKTMLRTGVWTFVVIIFSSFLLVGLGIAAALLVHLPRIPMSIEVAEGVPTLDVRSLLRSLFPYSSLKSLFEDEYLLPCFIFAGLTGAAAADDKSETKTAVSLFTSLSRVCYTIMGFFTELMAVGMIALSLKWMLDFNSVKNSELYLPLFTLLTVLFFVTAVIVYPLILRFVCHDTHPFRVLYASIAPVVMAFFSGDTNLTLPLSIRHGRESLGIHSKVSSVTYPLFSVFAKGGSALVASVCFIVILRSYSMLYSIMEIKISTVLWIAFFSFLFSFALGGHATGNAFLLLSILCIKYGGGYEAGYLLLRNTAPLLSSFAVAFDALTAMTGSYIVGIKTESVNRQEIRKFI